MLFRRLRQARTNKAVLFWLIPALLLSLGLRVCLHFPDAGHDTPVHLESALAISADHGTSESTADVDLPLFAVFKTFYSALAFAIVSTLVLLATAPRPRRRRLTPSEFWFPPTVVYSLTPPLRAPPR